MKKVTKTIKKSTQAVFGAAPSLAAMRSMNKNNKKSIFRGATFWYYFRIVLPYLFPVMFLIAMILALTVYKTVEGSLVLGSILSLFMTTSVVASYIMIIPWRKHPSSLVFYRSMLSIVFSVNIILEAISTNNASCRNYATVTQFTLLAGEGWLTTIALDLVYSLTNPFISYKSNLKKYQIMVWGFTSFVTFIFYFDRRCQGQFDQGICWVKISSTNSPCLWGYFLFWIICMYAYQIWASIFAYLRLKKGLAATFEIRKKCAQETFKCLTTYAIYLSVLMFMFAIISSDPSPKVGSDMANFSLFFLFIIANRGSIDGIVWFMLHDFTRGNDGNAVGKSAEDVIQEYDELAQEEEEESQQKLRRIVSDSNLSTVDSGEHGLIQDVGDKITKDLTKTVTKLADIAIAEFDETDLSPQVNLALRQQIVQYVTMGVKNSVLKIDIDYKPNTEISDIMDNVFKPADKAIVDGLQVLEFMLEREHPFKAFAPDLFKELRQNEGISDENYLKILSASANERLSEGASGAFMFFCGGGEFIVKTIRAREARVLHKSLNTYSRYLKQNKNSLLCRFLGSYSLEMFSQVFYFVVMLNCFDPNAYINERFDIKGSWVGRSAEPPKKTKKTVCRHCNEYFIPARHEQCLAIVGYHEANVVLRDNDLRTKISLDPRDATRVLEILKKDSDLLGRLGVLDYSLLLGVKKWKFEVDITDEMVAFKPSSQQKEKKSHDAILETTSGMNSTFRAKTVSGPAVYHLGIVDFLQDWTTMKKIERAFKIYVLRKDADGISVMAPEGYKLRFQSKMDKIFDLDGTSGGIGMDTESREKFSRHHQQGGISPKGGITMSGRDHHGYSLSGGYYNNNNDLEGGGNSIEMSQLGLYNNSNNNSGFSTINRSNQFLSIENPMHMNNYHGYDDNNINFNNKNMSNNNITGNVTPNTTIRPFITKAQPKEEPPHLSLNTFKSNSHDEDDNEEHGYVNVRVNIKDNVFHPDTTTTNNNSNNNVNNMTTTVTSQQQQQPTTKTVTTTRSFTTVKTTHHGKDGQDHVSTKTVEGPIVTKTVTSNSSNNSNIDTNKVITNTTVVAPTTTAKQQQQQQEEDSNEDEDEEDDDEEEDEEDLLS